MYEMMEMSTIFCLLAMPTTALTATSYNNDNGWKQDRFAISFWVDPIVPPSMFDEEYQRIADANFTVLLGGFGATDPATVELQIAAASKVGLAPIPSICNGDCVNISGAWGYQIYDEPSVSVFSHVAGLVAEAKARGQLAFVNLLPNYATPGETGAATYGEYVAQFVATVQPNILCVDHYPDFDWDIRSNKTKAGYIDNLLVLRDASLKSSYKLDFWNFFNAMPYNVHSQFDISEAELRWQMFTSLAIGAKGVLYFCYWTPPGIDFSRGQAIMTPTPGSTSKNISFQSPSHKYPMAQRINSKLRVLGDYLLESTSSGIIQAAGNQSSTLLIGSGPIVSINGSGTGPTWSFLLGFFDNNHTLVLSNQDSNHPALATVGLAGNLEDGKSGSANAGIIMELDPSSGTLVPALDDSPYLQGFQVSLLAGDARVFTWKSS